MDFIADSSDFTRATLSLYNSANHTYYWIRSAPVKSAVAYYITEEGLCNYINCEATAFAIRPCFSL